LHSREFSKIIGFSLALMLMVLSIVDAFCSGDSKNTYEYLELFAETLHYVEKNYVDPVDRKILIEGAIEKMMKELDPESYLKIQKDVGEDVDYSEYFFRKLGVNFFPKNGYVTLVTVLEGSPLYSAGLRAGDILRGVNDKMVLPMGIYEFYEFLFDNLKGKKEAKFTYIKDNKSEDVIVKVPDTKKDFSSVAFHRVDETYLCVKISSFQKRAKEKIVARLSKYGREGPKGIILDLRDCCNGMLSEALDVADIFLTSGKIGIIRFNSGREIEYTASDDDWDVDLPLAVIINENTVKFAELVASALKGRPGKKLIGEKTPGYGKYQVDIQLNGKFILHLSKAEFLDPNGKRIEKNGVEPDVVYEEGQITSKDEKDPLLMKSIEILRDLL